ncbi:hypothetical protein DWQ65_10765 [Treponema phagedenis]|nr:hypothetical protein DWQ65_10765 [Treponema phagedenis]
MVFSPDGKIRTAADVKTGFKHHYGKLPIDVKNSERARTPVVPNRNEFKNYHSYINRSFQTHRFHFAMDGKQNRCVELFL